MIRSEAICREKKNVSVDPQHTLFEQCSSSPDLSFQHIKRKYRNLRSQKKNNNLSGNPFSRVFFFLRSFKLFWGICIEYFFSPQLETEIISHLQEIGLRVFLSTTSQRGRESPKIGRMKKRRKGEGPLGGDVGVYYLMGGERGGFHKL